MTRRVRLPDRLAAAAGLLFAICSAALALEFAVSNFPRGLLVVACAFLAIACAWYGLVGAGLARFLGAAGCAVAVVVALVLLSGLEELWRLILTVAALAATVAAARRAFKVRVPLPDAPDPISPVLFFNPKSGGGKAEKFSLAEEARARGIRPIGMEPGCDLEQLAREAVESGADGLAMAGGDGSQAVVAAVAAEHELPYACIPAGTRNHFALDLGVERNDVVGALDAFVGGGERRVDLAEVNGRVFVNNVSLGLYAEAVRRDGYREAKLKTLLETGADMVGPDGEGQQLVWKSPSGREHSSGAAILVSNNEYRLGGELGSGTRPKIDDGKLGVTVFTDPLDGGRSLRRLQRPWRQWSAVEFTVSSEDPVAAGIDGESVRIDPPLRFYIRPAALRVRIARDHPGASPSAAMPSGFVRVTKALLEIASGRPPAERSEVVRVTAREDGRGHG
jgi:diacylglycerol kinase family enzyme